MLNKKIPVFRLYAVFSTYELCWDGGDYSYEMVT